MSSVAVFVGLDYHSESIQVCVMTEDGRTLRNRRVPNEVGHVVECVRGGGGPDEVVLVKGVALEACCGAADCATALAAATEWTVKLAHAGAVRRLKANRDKTDRGDAWHLANLLRTNYLPEVWLADDATRQLRRLVRHRQSVMDQAKTIKLQIRSLLKEERMAETCSATAWTKTWRTWLTTVPLSEQGRWVLERQLALLARLEEELRATDQHLEQVTKADPLIERLLEQPGVGLVTACLLRAVIGRFDRFRTGKQLAKYCGLSPCNASSGRKQADAGLITAGHDDLRAVLIQLAKRLPRHESRWKDLHAQLRRTKPANVASAALANRWVRRLHYELTRPGPVVVG